LESRLDQARVAVSIGDNLERLSKILGTVPTIDSGERRLKMLRAAGLADQVAAKEESLLQSLRVPCGCGHRPLDLLED
jgi:hypothetical protein